MPGLADAAAPDAPRVLARPRRRLSPARLGLLGILPALLLIGVLILYPVGYAIWLSFFDKHSFFPAERWVGLGNYARLIRDAIWVKVRAGDYQGWVDQSLLE